MRSLSTFLLVVGLFGACKLASASHQGSHDRHSPDQSTNFSKACPDSAQQRIMQAMSAVYEFDVGQASATFSSVLDKEPECVMAYWGLALLALGHMYIAAPDERNLIQAGELLARKPAGAQMSAREGEYFDMLS